MRKKYLEIVLNYAESRGIISTKNATECYKIWFYNNAEDNSYNRDALKKAIGAILRAAKRETISDLQADIMTGSGDALRPKLEARLYKGWQEVENDVIEVLTPQENNLALQSAKVSDQQCKKIILAIFDRIAKEAEAETEAA